MSQTMKNITVALLALTLAYAGYYMYTMNDSSSLSTGGTEVLTDAMLAKTQLFIERRVILSDVKMDTTVFDDPVFNSYKGLNVKIEETEVGRDNPFSRATYNNVNRF